MTQNIYQLLRQDEMTLRDIALVISTAIRMQIKLIAVILAFFVMIALLDYKLSPKEYESKASVLLESNSSNVNANLNILSGLLGNNSNALGGSQNGAVSPDMYNSIVSSQAFLNSLVAIRIPKDEQGRDSITLEQYFADGQPKTFSQKVTSFPSSLFRKDGENKETKIISSSVVKIDTGKVVQNQISADMFFSSKVPPIVQLEGLRGSVVNIIKTRVKVELKEKSAIVTVKMPESFMAAAVSKLVLQQLIDYVTSFNTAKQRSNIAFLEKRYEESKQKYLAVQQRLAGVRDHSLGLIMQSAQTREQVLANEASVTFNVYNQFAVQLESARIDLKKETPLFTVLEPITLPSDLVEPTLLKKLVKYMLLSILCVMMVVGFRIFFPKQEVKNVKVLSSIDR